MIEWIVAGVVVSTGMVAVVVMYTIHAKQWKKALEEAEVRYNIALEAAELRYNKAVSHRKSSEVRLGLIGENLAPFLKDWPYDPNDFRFLGNPIDGLHIDKDGVRLIEIKTGNARLSKTQKQIRQLVREGKVYFETFRISDKGCSLFRDIDLEEN